MGGSILEAGSSPSQPASQILYNRTIRASARSSRLESMKGTVVYFFAFDVANDIRTELVREILSERPFPFQIRVGGAVPKDVPFYRPLTIGLKPEELDSNVGRVPLKPFVKIFDVGVLSISYEIRFDVSDLGALVPFHQLEVGGVALTARAERLCRVVEENLRPFMVKPAEERPAVEAYTAFCFEEVDGDVQEWGASHRAEIAALLNEEARPDRLAPAQVEETLSHSLSYTREDFT